MGARGRRRRPAGAARGVFGLVIALVLAVAAAGCTRAVAGTPVAAAPHAFPVTATASPGTAPLAGPAPATAAPTTGDARAPAAALEPDVLADECLLDTTRLAALLGRPVGAPEQVVVRRDDGSRSSSCYAAAAEGPAAAVNVYRVRAGTPAAYVRAAGGRALGGAGAAAALLDTAAGPTLQVAGRRFVVSLAVQGVEPDDRAWRAAARAALARLPA